MRVRSRETYTCVSAKVDLCKCTSDWKEYREMGCTYRTNMDNHHAGERVGKVFGLRPGVRDNRVIYAGVGLCNYYRIMTTGQERRLQGAVALRYSCSSQH